MLNLFVRLEVQRRYFSVVSMEMIAMTFGMKEPSSLEALLSADRPVTLEQLIFFGRDLTVDQFLETKLEFDNDDELREGLIRDRETFVVRKDSAKNNSVCAGNTEAPKKTAKGKKVVTSPPQQDFGVFAQFMGPDKTTRNLSAVRDGPCKL
jgi:hypothetical protein